ncbi:MAG: malto-oligosyltrehalose synthase [Planctomycetes bacterium]|nr:malto-oligosyltrehalose synthase [Planctomycetota bacterium]
METAQPGTALVRDDIAQDIARWVIETVRQRSARLTATYRLQLHRDFTFRDAAAILTYLKDLGVSHVYCSPYLRARKGSSHGYDICDHNEFNPELGGEAGFLQFVTALRELGMGQILDIVPNHMAASLENPWWFDVLENGPVSPYSTYFDIDWNPAKKELADKVLLPVLGRQYGEALEDGELQLAHHEGAFFVVYFEQEFPLGPRTTIPLLAGRLEELRSRLGADHPDLTELESIITALDHLPPQAAREPAKVRERHREKEVIKRRLRDLTAASDAIRQHIHENLLEYTVDPARPEATDRLDRLLDEQPYRLSHWRSAADEINYRRFFDVNELAAICMELPEVFHSTHALLRPYLADGTITGLRIDHVDGLYDPEQYLWRLQWAYLADLGEHCFREHQSLSEGADPASAQEYSWQQIAPLVLSHCSRTLGMRRPIAVDLHAVLGPEIAGQASVPATDHSLRLSPGRIAAPLFVLVEKILGPDEPLPESWPVEGTSGYDFMNSLGGLHIVREGYQQIVRDYHRFLDRNRSLSEVEHDSKLLILRVAMASELQMLAHRLNHVSEQHRRSRDFTLNNLRLAIRDVLACFPVYRVYPGPEGISDRDRRFVNLAVNRARRRNPAFDPAVVEFLRSVLLLVHPPGLSPAQIIDREIFTGKFQQVTSPVMAKGVEDTAFYVHVPLVSVNEVGNAPERATTSIAEFHDSNRIRNRNSPRAMLATSTHDTKRSEDVRARLHVLSEIPREWRSAVSRFARLNKSLLREVDGEPAPSRNDEYLYYQTVLGIWPLEKPSSTEHKQLVDRLIRYMEKATREAKQRTSWNNPNEDYDAAVREFVTQTLRESSRNKFLKGLSALHARIVPAGQCNALGQVALKLLSPGVPDIYQGQELWDFSLVDPDNRRPVDFSLRQRYLAEIRHWDELTAEDRSSRAISLGRSLTDPRLKLLVTYRLLTLRRLNSDLFFDGEYVPLETKGPKQQHIVAFGWRPTADSALEVVAVIPRQVVTLISDRSAADQSLWEMDAWKETEVVLSPNTSGPYRCVFTERTHAPQLDGLPVSTLLDAFPLSVLQRVKPTA